MLELPRLILASGSPRRAEILAAVGWPFSKLPADIDESELPGETPAAYVERLAREKAGAVELQELNAVVLGADTTVVIDDEIIGKPFDHAEGVKMIDRLAGEWHEVLTGIALAQGGQIRSAVQSTRVKFASMSKAEIEFLAERGDPLDKAGGYAVQAQAALFIERIDGDYWNVVGLPIRLVYELMSEFLIPGPASEKDVDGNSTERHINARTIL